MRAPARTRATTIRTRATTARTGAATARTHATTTRTRATTARTRATTASTRRVTAARPGDPCPLARAPRRGGRRRPIHLFVRSAVALCTGSVGSVAGTRSPARRDRSRL